MSNLCCLCDAAAKAHCCCIWCVFATTVSLILAGYFYFYAVWGDKPAIENKLL